MGDGSGVPELTQTVRTVIADTSLAEFFDPRDLQAGEKWREALRENAGRSALLALRTDLYASRNWCQWPEARAVGAATWSNSRASAESPGILMCWRRGCSPPAVVEGSA
jgi:hypothetical protein